MNIVPSSLSTINRAAECFALRPKIVLLCAMGLLASSWRAECQARRFVASDTVNRERIGAVVSSPSGDYIVFERESAYGSGSDFTLGQAGEPWGRSDLYLVGTLENEATPRRLLSASDGRHLTLGGFLTSGSFSPDGKKITVFWPDGPTIHLGYYDFESSRLLEISDSPIIDPSRVQPVWLSATRLIYMMAASSTEAWPAERYRVARSMGDQWANARAGRATARTFVSPSPTGQFENDYAGSLLEYDTAKQQQRILSPGRFSTIVISPDGLWIAALRLIGRATQPPDAQSDFEFDRGEIIVFGVDGTQYSVASGASCDALHDSIAWSADSQRLAYFARPLGGRVTEGSYWLFDLKVKKNLRFDAGAVKLERADFVLPATRAFPVARGIVFEGLGSCENSTESGRYIYYQEPHSDPRCISPLRVSQNSVLRVSAYSADVFSLGQVWRLFIESRRKPILLFRQRIQAPNVSNEFGIAAAGLSSTPFRPLVTFAAVDPADGLSILSMDLRTRKEKITVSPDKRANLLGGTPASGAFLYRLEREGVSHILLAKPHSSPREVMVLNQSYAAIDLPIVQPLPYFSSSGMPLISCITTPRSPPPPHGFPTIVVLYPGYRPRCAPSAEAIDLDLVEAANISGEEGFMASMASQGFAILTVATPFDALPGKPKHGIGGLDELLEIALRAGAQKGLVDVSRVGLEGHSQGAVAALWVLSHSKRYSAAVLASGVSDNVSAFGALRAGVLTLVSRRNGVGFGNPYAYTRPDSRWYLGGAPWEVPEAYIEENQILHSARISTPLMLFNSDMDVFGMGQYEELYSALEAQGSQVTLVTYVGEGHTNASPSNIIDAWTRQVEWFSSHLRATGTPPAAVN
jgi:dipeptidyl aminopeptidase/acylaminoacyl peptidase